jgi:hypothetical protein
MLQRHQLLAEFDALIEADKEKYAPFEDILRAAQVNLAMSQDGYDSQLKVKYQSF